MEMPRIFIEFRKEAKSILSPISKPLLKKFNRAKIYLSAKKPEIAFAAGLLWLFGVEAAHVVSFLHDPASLATHETSGDSSLLYEVVAAYGALAAMGVGMWYAADRPCRAGTGIIENEPSQS